MTSATLKLFASLGDYLPPGAKNNTIEVELPPGEATITAVLGKLNVPMGRCHLVLVNGLFVPPGSRAERRVEDGDTIAAWPPVAGG